MITSIAGLDRKISSAISAALAGDDLVVDSQEIVDRAENARLVIHDKQGRPDAVLRLPVIVLIGGGRFYSRVTTVSRRGTGA